jgi:uncharacterized LabA/DUF88 family protein
VLKESEKMRQKAMVYLDQNNLFFRYPVLDHVKILEYLNEHHDVIRATSYFALDYKHEGQRSFVNYLCSNGWRCESVDKSINTNVDCMLATDMCNDRHAFDHRVVVLISGDGDFSYPLNTLSKTGFFVHVIGAKDSTSFELRRIADKITYLEDIPGVIKETYKNDDEEKSKLRQRTRKNRTSKDCSQTELKQ